VFFLHQNLWQTRELSKQNLERVFPELSSSEREICYLILQNKKLSEIGILLNKTESNITTQRGNIRKKLGMNPSDNLQKVLEKRIRE
jgi:DNA-binding NarL/FixJ family response regulator